MQNRIRDVENLIKKKSANGPVSKDENMKRNEAAARQLMADPEGMVSAIRDVEATESQ